MHGRVLLGCPFMVNSSRTPFIMPPFFLPILLLLLLKDMFSYLKAQVTETEGEILHPVVCSLDGHNDCN